MTGLVGLGCYQGSSVDRAQLVASPIKLFLCHLCPDVAIALRAADPHRLIGLRSDPGDDAHQVDFSGDPVQQAQAFFGGRITPALAAVPAGTYSYVTGINESWPAKGDAAGLRWRAAFELALCRLVRDNLGLPYAWGAIPVGNLDAADVAIFAEVWREAWAVNYHSYLGPNRTNWGQETDQWYARRPGLIWLPELTKLGIPLRLLAGECGTYAPPTSYSNFAIADEAAVDVAIVRGLESNARNLGFDFVGACAFGAGTVGTMTSWDLTPALSVLAAAATSDPEPGPLRLPAPTPTPPHGGTMSADFPGAVWDPSPNFGYPNTGDPGRLGHRVVALALHVEEGSETATDGWFANPASQVASNVSNPKADNVPLHQHVHDDDAAYGNGIDTSLGIDYYGSDRSLRWLMDCYAQGINPNLVTRSMENEGLSGDSLTPAQLQRAIDWAIFEWKKEGWPVTDDDLTQRIVGHCQINMRDKAHCPGPGIMAQLPLIRAAVKAALAPAAPSFEVGPGFVQYLKDHPDLGQPRMDSWFDGFGDEYVYLTPTPQHPKGPLMIYRKSINEIALAFA